MIGIAQLATSVFFMKKNALGCNNRKFNNPGRQTPFIFKGAFFSRSGGAARFKRYCTIIQASFAHYKVPLYQLVFLYFIPPPPPPHSPLLFANLGVFYMYLFNIVHLIKVF